MILIETQQTRRWNRKINSGEQQSHSDRWMWRHLTSSFFSSTASINLELTKYLSLWCKCVCLSNHLQQVPFDGVRSSNVTDSLSANVRLRAILRMLFTRDKRERKNERTEWKHCTDISDSKIKRHFSRITRYYFRLLRSTWKYSFLLHHLRNLCGNRFIILELPCLHEQCSIVEPIFHPNQMLHQIMTFFKEHFNH